jgi:putative glutamine amidotransferase
MKYVAMVNNIPDMGSSYYTPFSFLGQEAKNINILDLNPQDVALVVFTGGADISPSIYNESVGKFTHANPERDEFEVAVFQKALDLNIPMFGVCRGLQFLTAMFGGKLVQHTNNDHASHLMKTPDGMEFRVSSCHHQMCLPRKQDTILGWSATRLSETYLNGDDEEIVPKPEKEVEAVYFPEGSAGVQYHPEMMAESTEGFKFVQTIINRYLLG